MEGHESNPCSVNRQGQQFLSPDNVGLVFCWAVFWLQHKGFWGIYRRWCWGNITCVCTVCDSSALLSGCRLVCGQIRNHCDRDMASQCVMGPCRDNLLGKWERMLSKTSDYLLFRDAGGLKGPGRCTFGPKNNVLKQVACALAFL